MATKTSLAQVLEIGAEPALDGELKSHVQALRRWLQSQSQLHLPSDDQFLVRFIRAAKFSQLKAQSMLENFVIIRRCPQRGSPHWFDYPDVNDPIVDHVLRLGYFVPLGREHGDKGPVVTLFRVAAWDPSTLKMEDLLRVVFMAVDVLLMSPAVQTDGVNGILDFEGYELKHAEKWTPTNVKRFMQAIQDCMPMKNNGMHYYRTSTLFNAVYEIFHRFTKEKIRKMVFWHSYDKESLLKAVPKGLIPSDMGGDGKSMAELTEAWAQCVKQQTAEFAKLRAVSLDADTSSADPKAFLSSFYDERFCDTDSVPGSFRKMEVN